MGYEKKKAEMAKVAAEEAAANRKKIENMTDEQQRKALDEQQRKALNERIKQESTSTNLVTQA